MQYVGTQLVTPTLAPPYCTASIRRRGRGARNFCPPAATGGLLASSFLGT